VPAALQKEVEPQAGLPWHRISLSAEGRPLILDSPPTHPRDGAGAGGLVDCHCNYVPRGNRPAGSFLEYGKFEGETGVSYIVHLHVDVQSLIEKSPPLVLAIRLYIKKSSPSLRKSL